MLVLAILDGQLVDRKLQEMLTLTIAIVDQYF